ncbi:hypothetical protein I4F81_008330 [Pyropia yezoensis]|uniref:Uncharacterized protein n=1 Tax=Pyropia yezoensis TaxID=2788 RepID=A0ACC3C6M8_PYRYE|nr:hypothetical protein I4F81_008330 [Neopyropia yezoensis]
MDALRAMPSPAVRRLVAVLDAAPWASPDGRAALQAYARDIAGHSLLGDSAVAAAVGTATATAARQSWSAAGARGSGGGGGGGGGGGDGWSVHGRVEVLVAVLTIAASRCVCGSWELLNALAAGVPPPPPPSLPSAAAGATAPAAAVAAATHPDAWFGTPTGAAYMALLDELVGWAADGALPVPLPGGPVLGLDDDGGDAGCPPSRDATPYTTARERVRRMAAAAALLRAAVASEATSLHALLRDRTQPGAAAALLRAARGVVVPTTVRTLAYVAPHPLLGAVPDMLGAVVDEIGLLAARPAGRSGAASGAPSLPEQHRLVALVGVVTQLGSADPPRLRALPQLPAVVGELAAAVGGVYPPVGGSPDWLASSALSLLTLYTPAPGGAAAVARCPRLLAAMTAWAAAPGGRHAPGVDTPHHELAATSASLLLHVCLHVLRPGGDGGRGAAAIPPVLRTPAARAAWAACAAAPANVILAAVGARLAALAAPAFCAATAAAAELAPPWQPGLFPAMGGGLVEYPPQCWTCGSWGMGGRRMRRARGRGGQALGVVTRAHPPVVRLLGVRELGLAS